MGRIPLELEGKFFCYKLKLEDATIFYVIARSINAASKKAEHRMIENVVSIDYVGEALP